MIITSDGADKLIKQLDKEKQVLMNKINERATYIVAVTENAEELKPDFDFKKTVEDIEKIENRILEIKHARNTFNNETVLGNIDLTIDKALVRMAMINNQIKVFENLANRLPKQRERDIYGRGKEIEYSYINYNISDAQKKVDDLTLELNEIKKELNFVNSTKTFEISDVE